MTDRNDFRCRYKNEYSTPSVEYSNKTKKEMAPPSPFQLVWQSVPKFCADHHNLLMWGKGKKTIVISMRNQLIF